MKILKTYFITFIIFFGFSVHSFSKNAPESFADLAEKLMPSVVNISTTQTVVTNSNPFPFQFPPGSPFGDMFKEFGTPQERKTSALGSGFIIDSTGFIVTNNHVIEGADEVSVKLTDGTELEAKILGRDKKTDLAVLKVETDKRLTAVKWGDSRKARVGDWVLAIGNPYGLGGSVTAGIISARNRDINSGPYDDFIQTDASINRGNSGGPMFNMKGEVIGINTAIFSPSGGNIGIGFAIPSIQAERVVSQLLEFGKTRRGWLGVKIQSVTDDMAESLGLDKAEGALVASVSPDSPADKAGMRAGDILIKFDGKSIKEMRELPRIVADTEIGRSVKVIVLRKGKERPLRVTIEELVEDAAVAAVEDEESTDNLVQETMLGMELEDITSQTRKALKLPDDLEGVVVAGVTRGSAAAEKGVRRGDVIVEITQETVNSLDAAKSRIESLRAAGRNSVLLRIYSRGDYRHLALKIDEEK